MSKRALLSVSDKTGLIEFSRGLCNLGFSLLSTGGTAQALREAGLSVQEVSDYTGFPEMLEGRVKTLHPKIYAGILARRDLGSHMKTLEKHGIPPLDLVVVNLYPFEKTAARRDASEEEVIEQIDIGGPSMIRAAAKNFESVGVVVDPEQYDAVLEELEETGELTLASRRAMAEYAFARTAAYDLAISRYLSLQGQDFPENISLLLEKVTDLRYGENPHQKAAYYSEQGSRNHLLSRSEQLHGVGLSFNNLLDLEAARTVAEEFTPPCAVIVKHNNPCGIALADTLFEAYQKALACDPISAFGGVVVFNRPVDKRLAGSLSQMFLEIVLAPEFSREALEILRKKPNVRLLADKEKRTNDKAARDMKRVRGGFLVQDRDTATPHKSDMEVVSRRPPTDAEWGDLLFAFRVAKHVKSNAIVMARHLQTLGIGAGQMSRLDAARLASEKARLDLKGCVVASDAFYPFADGLKVSLKAGASAAIEPGGSKRDAEVIAAADEAGAALVFTHMRHFRH